MTYRSDKHTATITTLGFPGVTLGGALRRRPNAFNLVHQLQFLERTGMTQELSIKSLEAWMGVSNINKFICVVQKCLTNGAGVVQMVVQT